MLKERSPEIHNPEMFDAVVVFGKLDKKSAEPRLDSGSGMAILEAGVIEDADATDLLILAAGNRETADKMKERLKESFDIEEHKIHIETAGSEKDDVGLLRRIKRKYPRPRRLAVIASSNPEVQKKYKSAGINLEPVPTESVFSSKIAESASSLGNITNISFRLLEQIRRYGSLMTHNSLFEVGSKA